MLSAKISVARMCMQDVRLGFPTPKRRLRENIAPRRQLFSSFKKTETMVGVICVWAVRLVHLSNYYVS
jgi:hypothetical protein